VPDESERSDLRWHRPRLTAVLVTATAGALAAAATGLPSAGHPLPFIARHAMEIAVPKWGTTEVVSEIVYGSRGWDTFGETFLLLAAVVAAVVVARSPEHRTDYVGEASAGLVEQEEIGEHGGADREEAQAREAERREDDDDEARPPEHADDNALGARAPERAVAMTVMVRVVARIVAPVLLVAGIYLAAWGYTPGGGFPAGVVLTGVAILLYAALGHGAVRFVVRPAVLEPIEMLGAAGLVAVGIVGVVREQSFLANWVVLAPQQTIRAGGTLQLNSLAELVEVATGLTIAIFAVLGMRHDWAQDEAQDEDKDGGSDEDET
jgi:multicomponent Na+:H+ antiporter subunit B